ncbi:MAG: heparinase II/III family protein, partial [Muribaculaceae bacterium]|nr:heparinase II/III family protein [Muribaculaceae bacterium]
YNETVLVARWPAGGFSGADAGKVLDLLDLSRPGLEKVAELHQQGQDSLASSALLDYFKTRTGVKSIGVNPEKPRLTKEERRWADEGMEHKFFVHKGYQPSYFYGDDINWQYWPVRDNELRWQLHRTKWWVPMGKTYRVTGDEKYAAEWVLQYLDWIKKNPLTEFSGIKDKDMEEVDNVYFAWRPLEVCDRLEHQIEQFELFLPSEHFTPGFLIDFLDNYHRHATFANSHYSKQGNHLLFEAQRVIFAGSFFPEFKDAAAWRKAGVDILNREIKKQVFADGVQYELDPGYHMACVGIFGKALQMMDANGYRGEFPASYLDTMEKMVEFTYNIAFPDYTLPVFSDNKLHVKTSMIKNYRGWQKMFPKNKALRYFATDGKKGQLPDYTSRAFADGGFYVMRNGWDTTATVMVLKAGPKGEWHNQFDNGTFEFWTNGRNFFPDSGSFIYGGDEEVLKQRDWFRQTAVHNTLTLDDKNLQTRVSKLLKWESTP